MNIDEWVFPTIKVGDDKFEIHYHKNASDLEEPKKVIYNPPATIVFWEDGTKTVVKCSEDDFFSPTAGFALCFMKRILGNSNAVFHKYLKEYVHEETD